MFDLKARKQKFFELRMVDGTVLHIKKASEDILIGMEKFEKDAKDSKNVKDVFDKVRNTVLTIINRNAEGIKYDNSLFELKDEDGEVIYDYDVCTAIFTEYSKFTHKVLSNPN